MKTIATPIEGVPRRLWMPLMTVLFIALYFFSHLYTTKFFAISGLILVVSQIKCWRCRFILGVGFLTLTYASAFVLNPITFSNPLSRISWIVDILGALGCRIVILIGIVVLGMIWLVVVNWRPHNYVGGARYQWRNAKNALLISVFMAFVFFPAMTNDLTYLGDECYHACSSVLFQRGLLGFFKNPLNLFLFMTWIIVGLGLFGLKFRFGKWRWLGIGWGLVGVLLFTYFSFQLDVDTLTELKDGGRISRYPNALCLFGSFIGIFDLYSWGGWLNTDLAVMRLLPLISLFILAFVLSCDMRLRKVDFLFRGIAACAFVSIPNLIYHGSLLYLELPAILCITVVLIDCRKLLTLPYPRVCARGSWLFLVFIGFTKETVLPFLLLFSAFRFIRIVLICGRGPMWKRVGQESFAQFCILGPLFGYLFVRWIDGARPYAGEWGNIFSISLIGDFVFFFTKQTGAVLGVAALGFVVCLLRKKWLEVSIAGAVFLLTSAFFICDDKNWLGLARFNLLLLPPVIFIGWQGIVWLVNKSVHFSWGIVLFLVVCNLFMSPVGLRGQRSPWGGSGERWYPFEQVFRDLEKDGLFEDILVGNMPVGYTFSLSNSSLVREKRVKEIDYDCGRELVNETVRTIVYAMRNHYDVVIMRKEIGDVLSIRKIDQYCFYKCYDSPSGELVVFVKMKQ